MADAVCHRCGGSKKGAFVPCKSCGYAPQGHDRPVAWLFSRDHLDEAELDLAASRVREGERPNPSRALRQAARHSMGPDYDDRLAPRLLLGLAVANFALTPLTGFAVWLGLRDDRPAAARQALRVTLPMAVGFAMLWVAMMAAEVILSAP